MVIFRRFLFERCVSKLKNLHKTDSRFSAVTVFGQKNISNRLHIMTSLGKPVNGYSTMAPNVVEEEGTFQNGRGQAIFFRDWTQRKDPPVKCPRALVVLCHGFGDHSGRMREVAESFAQVDYLTTCIDFVGMGRSEGERGMVREISHYTDDILQHTLNKQREHPGVPTFIAGHSMGSHVAVRTVLFHPDIYQGLISSAAPLTVNPRLITPTKYVLAKIAAHLFPSMIVQRFDDSKMSRDPAVMRKFEADELCYKGGLKARWCFVMYYSLLYLIEHMDQVSTPLLALHGSDDVVCETKGSRDLVARAGSKDKTLKIYDGAYHSLFQEPEYKSQVISDCVQWIEERIPGKSKL